MFPPTFPQKLWRPALQSQLFFASTCWLPARRLCTSSTQETLLQCRGLYTPMVVPCSITSCLYIVVQSPRVLYPLSPLLIHTPASTSSAQATFSQHPHGGTAAGFCTCWAVRCHSRRRGMLRWFTHAGSLLRACRKLPECPIAACCTGRATLPHCRDKDNETWGNRRIPIIFNVTIGTMYSNVTYLSYRWKFWQRACCRTQ